MWSRISADWECTVVLVPLVPTLDVAAFAGRLDAQFSPTRPPTTRPVTSHMALMQACRLAGSIPGAHIAVTHSSTFAASARGRSGFGWFVLAALASPLIAAIVLALLPARSDRPTPETHVRCPECKELVLKDARLCKHCGTRLIPLSATR